MAESIVKALNPDAVLIKSTYGKIALQSILDTKLFDGEEGIKLQKRGKCELKAKSI